MPTLKRFGSNEEVILEMETYFAVTNKSFFKKDLEMLESRWNDCIALEESPILLKNLAILKRNL